MKRALIIPLFLSIAMSSTACAADSPPESDGAAVESIKVEVLSSSVQCGGSSTEARVSQITTQDELDRISTSPLKTVIGAPSPKKHDVDLASSVVLLIEMGQRPTLGYGLRLVESHARVAQKSVQLSVEWVEPSPDMAVGQTVTSPCLVLKLERGSYETVVVKDQQGEPRTQLVLK